LDVIKAPDAGKDGLPSALPTQILQGITSCEVRLTVGQDFLLAGGVYNYDGERILHIYDLCSIRGILESKWEMLEVKEIFPKFCAGPHYFAAFFTIFLVLLFAIGTGAAFARVRKYPLAQERGISHVDWLCPLGVLKSFSDGNKYEMLYEVMDFELSHEGNNE
jgi:hypothetical protein